jgi:hypothetical protein
VRWSRGSVRLRLTFSNLALVWGRWGTVEDDSARGSSERRENKEHMAKACGGAYGVWQNQPELYRLKYVSPL